jgi:hypothetical protein
MSLFMFKLKLWLQNKHIIRFSTVLFTFLIVLMIMIPAIVLSKEITIKKKTFFFLFPTHFFPFSPSFSMSFIHPLSRPSSFSCSLRSFLSLSLSHFATFIPHVLNCLSFLIAHSAPCFLSFRLIPVSSLLNPTSKSRHHFSFFCTLSPQVFQNFLCHTPLILPVVSGFFDSLPSFLLCVSALHSSIFLLLSSFHFFTIPLVVFLSFLLLHVLFLFSPAFHYYPALFPSVHFVLKLSRSLFRFHSQPLLALFPHYYVPWCFSVYSYHPSQIFFLHSLYLLFFLPLPDLCPVHQYTLKHHHSLPEITFPLSLSYSPHTCCFPHYLPDMCLIRGSFVECVGQVFDLFYLFYLPSFSIPLILFTLPLSLVEHHHFRLLNIHFYLFLPHILSQGLHHLFHFSFAPCHNFLQESKYSIIAKLGC